MYNQKQYLQHNKKDYFAIANGNNEVVRNVISRYKYEKTEQIKMSDYDQIVQK